MGKKKGAKAGQKGPQAGGKGPAAGGELTPAAEAEEKEEEEAASEKKEVEAAAAKKQEEEEEAAADKKKEHDEAAAAAAARRGTTLNLLISSFKEEEEEVAEAAANQEVSFVTCVDQSMAVDLSMAVEEEASVGGANGHAHGADGLAQYAAATKIQARARGARDRQRVKAIKDEKTAGAAAAAAAALKAAEDAAARQKTEEEAAANKAADEASVAAAQAAAAALGKKAAEEEAAAEAAAAKKAEEEVEARGVVTASVGGASGQEHGADGQAQNAAATKIQARARGARDRQRVQTIKNEKTSGAAGASKKTEEAAAAKDEQVTGAGSEEAAAASASAPVELAGEAAIWQQMTDEASGKPYWSLTRCVLPDERARVPLPLLPLPPRALAPPATYTVESRVPAACDRCLVRATGIMQRQASPPGPRPRQRTANWW